MVFSYAFCALNLASTLVANGICCVYQMHKDEERKQEQEAILRETIQARWELHRLEEMSERQRRERHGWKHETEEDEEERRIRLVVEEEEANSKDLTIVHQNLRVRSIRTTEDERQSPTHKVADKQLYPALWHDRRLGGNLGRRDCQTTSLLSSTSMGKQVGDATIFRGHLSNGVSLMDESDDEDQHLEEVCIE